MPRMAPPPNAAQPSRGAAAGCSLGRKPQESPPRQKAKPRRGDGNDAAICRPSGAWSFFSSFPPGLTPRAITYRPSGAEPPNIKKRHEHYLAPCHPDRESEATERRDLGPDDKSEGTRRAFGRDDSLGGGNSKLRTQNSKSPTRPGRVGYTADDGFSSRHAARRSRRLRRRGRGGAPSNLGSALGSTGGRRRAGR